MKKREEGRGTASDINEEHYFRQKKGGKREEDPIPRRSKMETSFQGTSGSGEKEKEKPQARTRHSVRTGHNKRRKKITKERQTSTDRAWGVGK